MVFNLSPTFKNNISYNNRSSQGKREDIKSRITPEQKYNEEYEKGDNLGYTKGKEKSKRGYATVDDVIQDLVRKGMQRKQAVEFVAQYLGGW